MAAGSVDQYGDHVCSDLQGRHPDLWMCVEGFVYGPCEHPLCNGVCVHEGRCQCDCH